MARILVVDDDAAVRSTIGTILQAAGHEVGYAADGDQGIAFFKKGGFDLAIVDLVMPVKNGLLMIRELRAWDPGVKIIAISGMSPEQLPVANEAGALHTLTKPINQKDLLAAIASLLRRSTGWQGVLD